MNTITHENMTFKVEHEPDQHAGFPWDDEGHGPVSDWTRRDKRPGELVLNSDSGRRRFYDLEQACNIALRDNWGYWEPDCGMTRREFAAQQAREDFQRLKDWCDDRWSYVGVIVTLLDAEGDETDAQQSLWRIESDDANYLAEVAGQLVEECYCDIRGHLHYTGEGDTVAVYTSGSRTWVVSQPGDEA